MLTDEQIGQCIEEGTLVYQAVHPVNAVRSIMDEAEGRGMFHSVECDALIDVRRVMIFTAADSNRVIVKQVHATAGGAFINSHDSGLIVNKEDLFIVRQDARQ